ncbi:thiamine phosphate synthase [Curtobacterium flaccumfaciens pv. poinsettiae]|uniref:thiamine phosphate synthase n=1 Tax=Curtobacterium poinsettiae TaxID=159612 RepID=UPI0021C807B5|nr:thiamine phosphate synthase [Curtobacterium flaccumfaciens]MCU0154490.1 thiamine phosphate synthase [Curtobacterium flaccumfaciens pv. poinsettiae]
MTDGALADRHGIGVLGVVRAAVHAGVRIVQVRDKDASARDLLALTAAVADAVGDRATVVVDDRLDVASPLGTPDTGSRACTSASPTSP